MCCTLLRVSTMCQAAVSDTTACRWKHTRVSAECLRHTVRLPVGFRMYRAGAVGVGLSDDRARVARVRLLSRFGFGFGFQIWFRVSDFRVRVSGLVSGFGLGFGFRVWFRVSGLVPGLGFDFGFRVWFWVSGFVSGFGFCFGFRVSGFPVFMYRVWCQVFRVSGSESRVSCRVRVRARVGLAWRNDPQLTTTSQKCEEVQRRAHIQAHRLVYHSTLGWRVIKKKKRG